MPSSHADINDDGGQCPMLIFEPQGGALVFFVLFQCLGSSPHPTSQKACRSTGASQYLAEAVGSCTKVWCSRLPATAGDNGVSSFATSGGAPRHLHHKAV